MIYHVHKHYLGIDFVTYLALDLSGMYYQYTELALRNIIAKLPQACYMQILDKYVAICHLCNESSRNQISLPDQATYQTLQASEIVIMFSNKTDIPTNLHKDLHKIL